MGFVQETILTAFNNDRILRMSFSGSLVMWAISFVPIAISEIFIFDPELTKKIVGCPNTINECITLINCSPDDLSTVIVFNATSRLFAALLLLISLLATYHSTVETNCYWFLLRKGYYVEESVWAGPKKSMSKRVKTWFSICAFFYVLTKTLEVAIHPDTYLVHCRQTPTATFLIKLQTQGITQILFAAIITLFSTYAVMNGPPMNHTEFYEAVDAARLEKDVASLHTNTTLKRLEDSKRDTCYERFQALWPSFPFDRRGERANYAGEIVLWCLNVGQCGFLKDPKFQQEIDDILKR
jgi:hypothetical protein